MGNPFAGSEELVLGTFRTLRVFKAARTILQPVSFWNVINYRAANEWYTFECNRWRWDEELILRRFFEYKRWLPSTPVRILSRASTYNGTKRVLHVIYEMPLNLGIFREQKWERGECLIPWDDDFTIPDNCEKPRVNCSCGFYSFYNQDHLFAGQSYWDLGNSVEYVFGVVENSGLVLHGTKGIRSERMRILGIATPNGFFVKPENHPLRFKFPYFQYLPYLLARFPLNKPPVD